jgi:hypothetical protein
MDFKVAKVLFIFSGTDATAGTEKAIIDTQVMQTSDCYNNDVVRIYLDGCQNSKIGGKSYTGQSSIISAKN